MKVAVLAGGPSGEHEISLASAEAVRDGLTAVGHEVIDVRIDREGRWLCEGEPVSITPAGGVLGADVVFPVLHGPYGEDGTVQGLLECAGVAYVGSGVMASSLCMDKILFKQFIAQLGLPQVDFRAVLQPQWESDQQGCVDSVLELGLPLFIKPSRLGSSVGISKVNTADELTAAITEALAHDDRVIAEAYTNGKEIECGVFGVGSQVTASVPGEITFEADWYDFEAKYTAGGMTLTVPATISSGQRAAVQRLAVELFQRSGCSGMARADFFVTENEILINELNTIPGFTATSVYAKLFDASGVSYNQLLEELLASSHYSSQNLLSSTS